MPQFTAAVWVGFPDVQVPMQNITVDGTFYSRVFGFDPADDLAPLPIENLD